jgi:hypothetical protein
VPVPSNMTSCTPTTSNLYVDSSLNTVITEPVLHKFLMFNVPKFHVYLPPLMLFIQRILPGPRLSMTFLNKLVS